jgi:hypothetical protein
MKKLYRVWLYLLESTKESARMPLEDCTYLRCYIIRHRPVQWQGGGLSLKVMGVKGCVLLMLVCFRRTLAALMPVHHGDEKCADIIAKENQWA